MLDYLIVGSGLFGATFARLATDQGKKVKIIEKRDHIGGNCHTENQEGINVHIYGPHIFHTKLKPVWDFINKFAEFNHYVNRPKVNYKGKIYSFPINLMTLYQLWDVKTPQEAQAKLDSVKIPCSNPKNLEEWILSQVGKEIYEIFIKGYTQKQWKADPKTLPMDIIKRLPIRLNFDDNYFNDLYQGIPINGYPAMIKNLLSGIEVELKTDYFSDKNYFDKQAKKIVYSGRIDEYFNYCFGELEYRTLKFEHEWHNVPDYQGNAVINFTESEIPYTRVTEHKHFEMIETNKTIVTKEYPDDWSKDKNPYYPIRNAKNEELFLKYEAMAKEDAQCIFGGRLGLYRYYDMDQVINLAFQLYKENN